MSNAPAQRRHRRRVLVIANETDANPNLCTWVRDYGGRGTEVLVVVPVLSDARGTAERRLARCVATLEQLGLHSRGEVGDADPVRALQDALVGFAADEVVVATHPAERSSWRAGGVVEKAQVQFHLPVTHLVIDAGTPTPSRTSR